MRSKQRVPQDRRKKEVAHYWAGYHQVTGAQLHGNLSENPCSMCLRIHLLCPSLIEVCPQDVNSPVLLGCSAQGIKELFSLQKNPRGRRAESYMTMWDTGSERENCSTSAEIGGGLRRCAQTLFNILSLGGGFYPSIIRLDCGSPEAGNLEVNMVIFCDRTAIHHPKIHILFFLGILLAYISQPPFQLGVAN